MQYNIPTTFFNVIIIIQFIQQQQKLKHIQYQISKTQMGCGSSVNHEVVDPKPKQVNLQSQNNIAVQQLVEIPVDINQQALKTEGKCFLFGQSSTQRKIIYFDADKLQFSIISSRTRIPSPPIKYQQIQVIYEQSQQLFSSGLFSNYSHPPYNFMFATFIEKDTVFLCGGANYDFQNISNETFLFHAGQQNRRPQKQLGQNLMGTKFQKLNGMNQRRFSHTGAFYKIGKLRYIFVFGGRGQKQQTLTSCQKYCIETRKWTQISPMRIGRSTCFSLIFQEKIYVFGGYTAQKKRSKKIQVYDPAKDLWEVLNIKLHRGIQAGLIFSPKPNEILLMGGNLELGAVKSTIRVNLAEQTYMWDSDMKSERLLQKGVKFEDQIFVFGGDFADTMERYNIKDKKWRSQTCSYSQYVSCDDINYFSSSIQTVIVKYEETTQRKKQQPTFDANKLLILGNDDYPIIMEINLQKWILKKKSVPMTLRLRCLMSLIQIKQGKYFICGGIDNFKEKASRCAYIYYSNHNKAIEVAKMKDRRYRFTSIHHENYIYVFGGRGSTDQNILKTCQKYSIDRDQWTSLPSLSRERADSSSFVLDNKIFIVGGCDALQSIYDIQIFDLQKQSFSIFQKSLPFSSDIRFVFPLSSKSGQTNLLIFAKNEVLGQQLAIEMDISKKVKTENRSHKMEEDFKSEPSKQGQIEQVQQLQTQRIKIQEHPQQYQQLMTEKNNKFQQSTKQPLLEKRTKIQEVKALLQNNEQECASEQEGLIQDEDENIRKLANSSNGFQFQMVDVPQLESPSPNCADPAPESSNTAEMNLQQSQSCLDAKQLNIKLAKYIQAFTYKGKYYFIGNKGFTEWNGKQESPLQNRVVINQVQLLQFPLEKFSFA